MVWVRRTSALILVASAIACTSDDVPTGDAGADARLDGSGDFEPVPPTPPEPPALPVMTPCPEGWREIVEDGLTLCEPWPSSGRQECGPGEIHVPGTDGCEPAGAPCPAGEWPEDLPTDRDVFYVRPGASGGTGARDFPFGTPDEAIFRAAPGDVIALSKGDHEQLPFSRDVEYVGACAAETRITTSPGDSWAVLGRNGVQGVLRNVTVATPAYFGIVLMDAGTSIEAHGVMIEQARGAAVLLQGDVSATFERTRIVEPRTDGSGRGTGFQLEDGARITVRDSVVEGPVDFGMRATAGSNVSIDNVAVWGTEASSGWCLDTRASSATTGRAFVCEDAEGLGINVGFNLDGTPSSTELEHVVVRRIANIDLSGENGRGIRVDLDATASLSKVRIEEASELALLLASPDPTLSPTAIVSDLVVRDTRGVDGVSGLALLVADQGRLTLERAALIRSLHDAIQVQNAELVASDVSISDVLRDAEGRNGVGLLLNSGASASVDRMTIVRADRAGMVLTDASRLEVRDLSLSDGLDDSAFGAIAIEGSTILLERGALSNLGRAGLVLERRASGTFTDVSVTDIGDAGSALTYGLTVASAGPVELTRASFERQTGFGLSLVNAMGTAVMRDLRVSQTARVSCSGCEVFGSGVAIFASEASIEGFLVEESAICGVRIGNGGQVTLRDGTVRGAQIGACVEDPGYDFSRLQMGVTYSDNETNLDSPTLPSPTSESIVPDFSER